jgi:hypothetical protein
MTMQNQTDYAQHMHRLRERAAILHDEFLYITAPKALDWMPPDEVMRRRTEIVHEASAVRVEMAQMVMERARVDSRQRQAWWG